MSLKTHGAPVTLNTDICINMVLSVFIRLLVHRYLTICMCFELIVLRLCNLKLFVCKFLLYL